jgi:hypothetical protein
MKSQQRLQQSAPNGVSLFKIIIQGHNIVVVEFDNELLWA